MSPVLARRRFDNISTPFVSHADAYCRLGILDGVFTLHWYTDMDPFLREPGLKGLSIALSKCLI